MANIKPKRTAAASHSFLASARLSCRLPHCRLTPGLQGTPANIRISFILPESTVTVVGDTTAADSGSIVIEIFLVGSENACISKQSAKSPFKVIQGH